MDNYLDVIDNEIDKVAHTAHELATAIKNNTSTEHTVEFLTQFMFQFAVFEPYIKKLSLKPQTLYCLYDLRKLIGIDCFDLRQFIGYEYDKKKSHSIQGLIYLGKKFKYFGVKGLAISLTEKDKPNLKKNDVLRETLKSKCMVCFELIDFIPLTMLEGLLLGAYEPLPKSRFIQHTFEMTRKEELFYALVYAKVYYQAKVVGSPHGGFYFQSLHPYPSHVVELNQCDIYAKPNGVGGKVRNKTFVDLPMARFFKRYFYSLIRLKRLRQVKDYEPYTVLVLPLIDDEFFNAYALSYEGFKSILTELHDVGVFNAVKMHPMQKKSVNFSKIEGYLIKNYVTDLENKNNFRKLLLGDFHTMVGELVADGENFLVASFCKKNIVDKGYLKNFRFTNRSFESIVILEPDIKKLRVFYNLNMIKVFNYFKFFYKISRV